MLPFFLVRPECFKSYCRHDFVQIPQCIRVKVMNNYTSTSLKKMTISPFIPSRPSFPVWKTNCDSWFSQECKASHDEIADYNYWKSHRFVHLFLLFLSKKVKKTRCYQLTVLFAKSKFKEWLIILTYHLYQFGTHSSLVCLWCRYSKRTFWI